MANVTLTSVRGRNYVCEAEQCPLPATWELSYDTDDPECSVGYEFCCATHLPAAHHSEALLLTEARATTAEQAATAALAESARLRVALQFVADWLADCWEPDDGYYGFAGVIGDVRAALAQEGN